MTWDAPREICDGCEVDGKPLHQRWGFQLPGPPGGIVASNGRILQCCDHMLKGTDVCTMGSDACNKGNHVLYSDDRGRTWNGEHGRLQTMFLAGLRLDTDAPLCCSVRSGRGGLTDMGG